MLNRNKYERKINSIYTPPKFPMSEDSVHILETTTTLLITVHTLTTKHPPIFHATHLFNSIHNRCFTVKRKLCYSMKQMINQIGDTKSIHSLPSSNSVYVFVYYFIIFFLLCYEHRTRACVYVR